VANAAQHACGSGARVGFLCRLAAGNLVVLVAADGPGGARIVPGGGLAGLVGRVEALDGTLTVESPDGGPTIVRATIPTGVAVAPTPALQSAAALPPSVQEPR
jgi:signal transduction histidine kinase